MRRSFALTLHHVHDAAVALVLCSVIAGSAWAASGGGETRRGREEQRPAEATKRTLIEDTHQAMVHFYRDLAAAEKGQQGAVVRISVWSDSINGWDGVTSAMRHKLQARFGDAGRGFVQIAPGWQYQHQRDIQWHSSSDWRTHVVNRGHGPGNRYGLAGVMAADGSKRSSVTYRTTDDHPSGGSVSRYRLYYQAYPEGGSVKLSVDGGDAIEVSMAATEMTDRVHELRVPDGPHSLEVSVGERNVRLYGVEMERGGPGVVVDSASLIGARVARLLRFDQAHWRRQIELREPDLLIFWLGANNATSRGWNRGAFIDDYGEAIANARRARPEASCLVVSITDIGARETGVTLDRVPVVVEAQRLVARNQRCAFFNLYDTMGGVGTMRRWHRGSPRLATPDYRHLTSAGALRVGELFNTALLNGYAEFSERD